MKANKAVKRLTHAEDLISDVMERYSDGAPYIRQQLLDAKAAVGRAKDAVKAQVPSRTKSAPKRAATKKAAVKVAGPSSSSWGQQGSRRKPALGRPRAGRRGTLTQNVPLGSRGVSQKVNFLGQGNKGSLIRSEERRVGKEGRSRWSPYH